MSSIRKRMKLPTLLIIVAFFVACNKNDNAYYHLPQIILKTQHEGAFIVEKNGEERFKAVTDSSGYIVYFDNLQSGDHVFASFVSLNSGSTVYLTDYNKDNILTQGVSKKIFVFVESDTLIYFETTIDHIVK